MHGIPDPGSATLSVILLSGAGVPQAAHLEDAKEAAAKGTRRNNGRGGGAA
jgi:hypothetical protein